MRALVGWFMVIALLGLTGCAPPPVESPPAGRLPPVVPFDELPLGARALRFLERESQVEIRVFRAGRLARLGHNHVIAARRIVAQVYRLDERLVADLVLPVTELTVDEPELRRRAGAGFEVQPDQEAIAGTRANMLGPAVLDAARYPVIRLRATWRIDASHAAVDMQVRDHVYTAVIPVRLETRGSKLVLSGEYQLTHAQLGLRPFSALAGALRVADELAVRFRLVGSI